MKSTKQFIMKFDSEKRTVTFHDFERDMDFCTLELEKVMESIYKREMLDPTGVWPFFVGYLYGCMKTDDNTPPNGEKK